MKVAVILPCHNEEVALPQTISDFRKALPEAKIVVCDNNSTDRTSEIALAHGAHVIFEKRRGKGEAVRRLFSDVDADIYVMADGDATYGAESAREMVLRLLEGNLDMVVGNRLNRITNNCFPAGHRFGNWLFTSMVKALFNPQINDLLSGYRVMSRRLVKSYPADARGFGVETELTIHALEHRLPMDEMDTDYLPRPVGSRSKLSTFWDGTVILLTIFRLLSDVIPLRFYGSLATLSIMIGLLLSIPIFQTYFAIDQVPRIPTVVLIMGLFILSIVFITSGIILERVSAMRRSWTRFAYLSIPAPRASLFSDQDRAHVEIAYFPQKAG